MFSSVTVFSFLQGTNPVNIFSIRLGVITIYLFTIVCLLFNETTSSTKPSQNIKIDMQMSFIEIEDPSQNGDQEEILLSHSQGFFWNGGFHKDFFSLEHLLQRCPYCLSVTNRSFPFTSRTNLLIVKSEFHVLPQPRFSGELSTFIFPFLFFIILFIYSWLELLHLS